jgi:hypothetical protein
MAADFEIPIKCPNCHIPLTLVQMQVTKVLEWFSEEGKIEDNGQGSTEVFCYNCNAKIGHYDANHGWGLFPQT